MFNYLGQTNLKTGEIMSVARIDGPSSEWRPRLLSFLEHKGPSWRRQIEMALTSPLDDLGAHFYLGLLPGHADATPVCHIMVSDYHGVALLGHVYTHPDQRQKGAIKALMDLVMKDCRVRGVDVIALGTGFDSPPFHIYKSFGFEPIIPGDGSMIHEIDSALLTQLGAMPTALGGHAASANQGISTRTLRWHDWPAVCLLSILPLAPGEIDPRSVLMDLKPRGLAEGAFIDFQLLRADNATVDGAVLVTNNDIAVGWATVAAVDVDGSDRWVVDAYVAPNFVDHYGDLIAALRLPDAPVVAYVNGDGPRADALRRAGIRCLALYKSTP